MLNRMMLRNTLLVARREYLERVRSRVFRITTVLVPVGLGALMFLGRAGDHSIGTLPNLGVVSNSPALAAQVKAALGEGVGAPKLIEVYAPATAADVARLKDKVAAHTIDGYLTVNLVPGKVQPEATWTSSNAADFVRKEQMQSAVRLALVREELLSRGMTAAAVTELMKRVKLQTLHLKNGVITASNSSRSFAGAYALIVVLYGAVLIYGINIARSVVEEKTSRIFEVLLSTASSDSLMLGKLLGVGAVGLTQMGIWAGLAVLFTGSALAAGAGIHGLASVGINGAELGYFLVFFLLGFLLYSAMAAALASAVSSEQDVQQFSFILVAPLVVSVVLLPYVLGNPSSTWSIVLSLIPPFTPIILYMRICSQMPALWQVVAGIALLAASVWAMIWLAARIYRIGVLMYGKRATLPEMLRWLRYS
jgi:ABC-2 type transport system permease protein